MEGPKSKKCKRAQTNENEDVPVVGNSKNVFDAVPKLLNTCTDGAKQERPKVKKCKRTQTDENEGLTVVENSMNAFDDVPKLLKAYNDFKTLLANECSTIYECKLCRNLFRSVANFISHKRSFCTTMIRGSSHQDMQNESHCVNENGTGGEELLACWTEPVPTSSNTANQTLIGNGRGGDSSMKQLVREVVDETLKAVTLDSDGTAVLSETGLAIQPQHAFSSCKAEIASQRSLLDGKDAQFGGLLKDDHQSARRGDAFKSQPVKLKHKSNKKTTRAQDRASLRCQRCLKVFHRKAAVKAHEKSCIKSHHCQICGRIFRLRSALGDHMRDCQKCINRSLARKKRSQRISSNMVPNTVPPRSDPEKSTNSNKKKPFVPSSVPSRSEAKTYTQSARASPVRIIQSREANSPASPSPSVLRPLWPSNEISGNISPPKSLLPHSGVLSPITSSSTNCSEHLKESKETLIKIENVTKGSVLLAEESCAHSEVCCDSDANGISKSSEQHENILGSSNADNVRNGSVGCSLPSIIDASSSEAPPKNNQDMHLSHVSQEPASVTHDVRDKPESADFCGFSFANPSILELYQNQAAVQTVQKQTSEVLRGVHNENDE